MLEESKIDEVKTVESKTKVEKIGELTVEVLKTVEVKIREVKTEELNLVAKEGGCSSMDEVEVILVIDMLS